jgi:superfamily I DNA and RNA helicase
MSHFGRNDAFGAVCKKAIDDAQTVQELYDVILVDEAQDFSPSFLLLCYELLREPKRLVYAYDELQNLRSQSLPSPEEIFGKTPDGKPVVSFRAPEKGHPEQDIILEKCYRNSRPALVTAHALGFGVYRKPESKDESGLVQRFEQNSLWQEIGYEIADGALDDGQRVILKRTDEGSPEFLESHSPVDDLISFRCFNSAEEQDNWVAQQIKVNLAADELRPDDIIVINPNPLTTKTAVAPIRKRLYEMGIASHTTGVDYDPDIFFTAERDSVPFTGIYRAKGNEAAMVYVINAQSCFYSSFDMAKIRNQIFTAITRSKAWVRVLGCGEDMARLVDEFQQVKDHNFTLDFVYPTKTQRTQMNIVNRDMTAAEKNRVKQTKVNLGDIIYSLESGQLYLEDLGESQIEKLRSLLGEKGE